MRTLFSILALTVFAFTIQAQGSAAQLAELIHGAAIDRALSQASEMVPQDQLATFEANRPQRRSEALQQLAGVYAANFNAGELAELANFYSSATGQKLASLQRGVGQQAAIRFQEWRQQLEDNVMQQ